MVSGDGVGGEMMEEGERDTIDEVEGEREGRGELGTECVWKEYSERERCEE